MQKYLIIALLITFASCGPSSKQVSPYLTIIEDESGENIMEDDFLSISYTEKTEEGDIVSGLTDYDDRPKLMFRESSRFKGDLFEMLGHLSEGDSAEFKIRIDSVVKKNGAPLSVNTKGNFLIYNVRVNRVVARGKMNDSSYNAAIENYRQEVIEKEKDREQGKLERYISKNNLKPDETSSGLKYMVTRTGNGNKAKSGDTVIVNYLAKNLSGKVFETTIESVAKAARIWNKEITYLPAKIAMIPEMTKSGFMEAMMMFPKGTKATLLIPSKLAYGSGYYKTIEPYTPLVCEFEIVDIISPHKR